MMAAPQQPLLFQDSLSRMQIKLAESLNMSRLMSLECHALHRMMDFAGLGALADVL
jgi:hypothetical protein